MTWRAWAYRSSIPSPRSNPGAAGKSRLRHPLVAGVFHKMAIIEKWGTGIRPMFALSRKNGAAASIVQPEAVFMAFNVETIVSLVWHPLFFPCSVASRPAVDIEQIRHNEVCIFDGLQLTFFDGKGRVTGSGERQ